MRKVLRNTGEVFHYWANEVQDCAECGNVSFDGPSLYSYARCIATIHHRNGETLVLFDTSGYGSVTTNRHISHARSASRQYASIDVPNGKPTRDKDHTDNLQAILKRIAEKERLAKRAKKSYMRNMWNEYALRAMKNFDAYAAFFGLTEQYSAKAVIEMEKRVAAEAEETRKRMKEQEQRQRERLADSLAKWRAGTDENGYWDLWNLPEVALRLFCDKVETTKGAEIPVEDALKLWPVIERCRAGERDFEPGQAVGRYRLTKIRRDGSIVVGCHDIPYSEIEMIARKLGLKEEAAV